VCAEVLRELDGSGSDRAGRAVDEDRLAGRESCAVAEERQRGDGAVEDRDGLTVGQRGRCHGDHGILMDDDEFGVCAEPGDLDSGHAVADGEP
jgi:hypothetical protein